MKRQFYNAKDLMEITGLSESKCYVYIRQMNAELAEKGFLTVRGKVPAAYASKRFGLEESITEDFINGEE